jgi:Na+-transporting methylmalonyl-CoA/oxaloacetate decarboxylase gamma subunit
MNSASFSILALAVPPAARCTIVFADVLSFLTAAGLLVAVYQLQRVARRLAAMEERLAGAQPRAVPSVVPREETLPAEVAAVIAAACHAALGRGARIVSIADASDLHRVWSIEGRRQIFASHQVR